MHWGEYDEFHFKCLEAEVLLENLNSDLYMQRLF